MRSIRRIAWFHEFWISNSNLVKMQSWNLCVSRSKKPKQQLNDDVEVECKSSCSSIMLQVVDSSNFHGWRSVQQLKFLHDFAPIDANSSCQLPTHEDSHKNLQEQWWNIDELRKKFVKKWRKSERVLEFSVMDLKKWLVLSEYSCNYLFIPRLNHKIN
jgi:hypothetical protein